ncbi:SDR family oxidoreductase, partial [Streptomyces sp. NPDC047981]|uniref:SDR family NAD(P)-dependent oxidoreductase n=1 Tax=Streptomyces sp. NPDC047981 TaxID=3154610 RepID=UPI00341B91A9
TPRPRCTAPRRTPSSGPRPSRVARREDRLAHHARLIRESGGAALCAPADVTDADAVQRAVDRALDTFGGLDAAFNNAGWASSGTPLHQTDDADYDRIMDVNVRGVWNCLRAQIDAMLKAGTRGSIVNTSSVAGLRATGTAAPYIAAKHAVLGLTRAAADEYGPHGIRVNALVVGSTRTELMDEVLDRTPSLYEPFTSRAIQRRLADPAEVAQAAVWLCSDRASFTTGAAVPVDGGWTAR